MAQREAAVQLDSDPVSIRRMTEHDLLEVVEIEQTCGLSPWGWEAYHAELAQGSAIMFVALASPELAEDGHALAGYIVARVISDELHVNNVAVRPRVRRHRIGTELLHAVLRHGAALGSQAAWLEVRAGNRAAQRLYESCGFQVVGRRRNYYSFPVEDALIMNAPVGPLP